MLMQKKTSTTYRRRHLSPLKRGGFEENESLSDVEPVDRRLPVRAIDNIYYCKKSGVVPGIWTSHFFGCVRKNKDHSNKIEI